MTSTITFTSIKKRNGNVVEFNPDKIIEAVTRAAESFQKESHDIEILINEFAQSIKEQVIEELSYRFSDNGHLPSVEEIQDIVELKLAESGHMDIARHYILYRARRAQERSEERLKELEKIEKNQIFVTKRNGGKERFDIKKIKKTFRYAVEGYEKQCRFKEFYELLKNVLVDGMETEEMLISMRRVAVDLVSIENTAWQMVAARLYAIYLYKHACYKRNIEFKDIYKPESYKALFDQYIKEGLYYKDFYKYYSEKDILAAGKHIDKNRDKEYVYSTLLAFHKRYLLNPNKIIRELPQEMYMSVALFLAIPEPEEKRFETAMHIYDICSTQRLSLATPTLLNARTNYHQLSSCFKLNIADDLRAIYHGMENMAQISKFGGGIGVYLGNVRSRGGTIRGVEGASGGAIPWVKIINDTAIAVNQLGARKGAISPTLDIWHRDIHDFLNLQTESGDIRAKAFDVFPAVSVPDLFMERVQNNENFTLFDPHEVEKVTGKRLQDHFGDEFKAFYEKCEKNKKLKLKVTIPSKELMKEMLKTGVETGMPYVFFRDTVNNVNPNKHVGGIYSTQLCTEICQNTSEAQFIEETTDGDEIVIRYKPGETVVCNLASINVAKVHTQEQIDEVFPIALRILDNVITLNFYPIKEAELTSKKYRSIGLGFLGLAEHLACNGMFYNAEESRQYVDTLFEKYAMATLRQSNALAKERGHYELFPGSEWSKGILFGRDESWYTKNSQQPKEWKKLISDIKSDGLRFSYHLAPAPNTSTAGVVGTTAGVVPIYKKFFVETNTMAPTVTVAPNLTPDNFWTYQEYMHLDMKDVIDMVAVMYKWVDQSISFEWMINPDKISPKDLYSYYMQAWESKIKTVYYLRSMSSEITDACESCSG